MAISSDMSIQNLHGLWLMDNDLSDDPSAILKLQVISWLPPKAIATANPTLQFTSTETNPPDPSELSTTHLTIAQTITGGIPGSTENRTLDWTEKLHSDFIFGECIDRSKLIDGVQDVDGMLRPDLHLQSEIKEGSDADRERVVGFLRGGAGTGPKDTSGGREEKLYMHDFVRNEEVGWTAEQAWGFEVINGSRYLTRRVVVVKEKTYEMARLVHRHIV